MPDVPFYFTQITFLDFDELLLVIKQCLTFYMAAVAALTEFRDVVWDLT